MNNARSQETGSTCGHRTVSASGKHVNGGDEISPRLVVRRRGDVRHRGHGYDDHHHQPQGQDHVESFDDKNRVKIAGFNRTDIEVSGEWNTRWVLGRWERPD